MNVLQSTYEELLAAQAAILADRNAWKARAETAEVDRDSFKESMAKYFHEAADAGEEIERLRADVARLSSGFGELAGRCHEREQTIATLQSQLAKAREALEKIATTQVPARNLARTTLAEIQEKSDD